MSGTLAGGRKASKTNKKRYGKDFYVNIGAKGGKALVPKGFARMDKEKVIEAGKKGGSISKRGKKGKKNV